MSCANARNSGNLRIGALDANLGPKYPDKYVASSGDLPPKIWLIVLSTHCVLFHGAFLVLGGHRKLLPISLC